MADSSQSNDSLQLQLQSLLEQSYLYQNNITGTVSVVPLTTRQLCRILSPALPPPDVGDSSASPLPPPQKQPHVVTPETRLLAIYKDGYDTEWSMAKTLPVLQQACASWYFVEPFKTDGETATTVGPMACRTLAKDSRITPQTLVWSPMACTEWTRLDDLIPLQAAIAAFHNNPPPSALTTSATEMSMNHDDAHDGDTADYDESAMIFDDPVSNAPPQSDEPDVQHELEAFLQSTVGAHENDNDDENDEGYESDGGTNYVKCPRSGNWIHEALAPPKPSTATTDPQYKNTGSSQPAQDKDGSKSLVAPKKRKKPKFSAKNAKCWIYVTGLPPDATDDEVAKFFSKVGILELDPDTQRPKIKLYRHDKSDDTNLGKNGPLLKGDASICYARPESVELALQLLDEAPFRPLVVIHDGNTPPPLVRVQRAKFEQHGDKFEDAKQKRISNAKRKVAKLAALQAVGWDEGDNGRITGGRKGLRIIILKHMFALSDFQHGNHLDKDEDAVLAQLEQEVRTECEQWGTVEKITIFSKHPEGVMIVKFAQPAAASTAVTEWDGRDRNGRRVEAVFWDGVTDYTVKDEEKEEKEAEKRIEEFGQWLENQEVPDEFRLQVEGVS